ncbi:MAG TPA: hypothetical protein VLB80_02340 [Candidatus Babeliales bacterium]|nr:hypothetical protein [Candidatus Babeliales bacterium]
MKLNEKTGLYENYGLWHVPFWQTQKFQLAVEIFACLVVLCSAFFLIRKYMQYRKRKKLVLWDQALLELSYLKRDQKVDVAHGKEFYLTVSVLLKKYFQDRFGYDLVSKTDDEAVQYLQEHYTDLHGVEEIKKLLQGSEIIKFANAQAAQEQIEHDYLCATAIITRTIPVRK